MATKVRNYEGIGDTLDEALQNAQKQIPLQPGRDFTISKVERWGLQVGGFVNAKKYYAIVTADTTSKFKT